MAIYLLQLFSNFLTIPTVIGDRQINMKLLYKPAATFACLIFAFPMFAFALGGDYELRRIDFAP